MAAPGSSTPLSPPVAPPWQAAWPVVGDVRAARGSDDPPGLVYPSGTSEPRAECSVVVSVAQGRVTRMRRVLKAAVRSIDEVALAGARGMVPWLLTLTYADADGWRKRHVSEFLNCLRKWADRRGFDVPYVWVAEMQEKRLQCLGEAAVHYHVVVWVPKRFALPKPDKRGWWPHGFTQCVRALRPLAYVMKYASKGSGSAFPRGLRLYGYGGLTKPGREVRYWLCLPGWLHRQARTFQRVIRLPGGLWLFEATGELVRSAWEFVRFDSKARTIEFRRRQEGPCPVM